MNGKDPRDNQRRILGRVTRSEFVGRADELARIVSHSSKSAPGHGLLVLLAPAAGVSELLRQAYDELFDRNEQVVPIYFAIPRNEATAVSVAIQFLNTFLLQYLAFRRQEPSLCHTSLLLTDILKLAPPADYEWIEELLETYDERRFAEDDRALIRFCLSVPQRVPAANGKPYVMIEAIQLADQSGKESLATEILRTLDRSGQRFVLAGLRRQILNAAHEAECHFESLSVLRLEKLAEADARQLVTVAARRQRVELNEETRDLLVQQFEGSPFFITSLLQAAREKNISLTSYLACEQLYVDELMGGHLHRYFTTVLDGLAPQPKTRRLLIRQLAEASARENSKASFEAWRKLLQLEPDELQKLLQGLHVQELLNLDGETIEVRGGPLVWKDYLTVRFRLDVQNDPRALVVADTIAKSLTRAPQTMAVHYRRRFGIKLRDLLGGFNAQLVPRALLDYEAFREKYVGLPLPEIVTGLDSETNLFRLPQVFYTAAASAYSRQLSQFVENDSCVVAHGFDAPTYAQSHQIVWLAAQVESKLEVSRELAELWCDRLEQLARSCAFGRIRILLVSNEGFSADALNELKRRNAFGISRQQVELLAARLGELEPAKQTAEGDEYVAILPMGDDNELLAAGLVEQIARRFNFKPEAINQIKTAIVEACINAAEHSLSPDRKIYQRFRVESDRLVITISSRGVVPARQSLAQDNKPAPDNDLSEERRGWGLKLIRSLMDEVEFERVDDGTSLRMIKYLRPGSS